MLNSIDNVCLFFIIFFQFTNKLPLIQNELLENLSKFYIFIDSGVGAITAVISIPVRSFSSGKV